MDKLIVISVVRDFAMYEKCIAGNPQLAGAELVPLDNRAQNEPIPALYNRFLDGYDYSKPAWFVFCHEDFQPLERLEPLLAKADVNSLWGPIGVRTVWRWGFDPHYQFLGRLEQCKKDGTNLSTYGKSAPMGERVETFDCQCLIVHSSLIAEKGMRFDERFAFDLYVEDFCVFASERAGVSSRILPLACRHWSHGMIGERYRDAERRFAEKWPDGCYTGTSTEVLGGGANGYRRMMLHLKFLKRKLGTSDFICGMAWSMTGRLAVKAVQFGFSIILARLLCPADFGLVGMIAVFMSLADILMDGGLIAALIRKSNRTDDDFSTVLWSKIVTAGLIYAALFALAPGVAAFYGVGELMVVMRVVTLGLPLVAVSSVFNARMVVGGRFRALARISAMAVLLSGIVGCALAGCRLGVWAVVGQGLAWQIFTLGILIAANRWLPSRRFSLAALREFFSFGWKDLLRGVLGTIVGQAYSIVIGKSFGAADLGLYNRADYYTSEAGGMVGGVVNEVNYPRLAAMQDDPERLRRCYLRLQMMVAMVMIPSMAILAVFAEPLVRFIIGEQWIGCVRYLQILAIGAAFSPMLSLTYVPMYVKGLSGLALKLELIEKPIAFALLLAALPFGIIAICITKSVTTLLSFVINEFAARRLLKSRKDLRAS